MADLASGSCVLHYASAKQNAQKKAYKVNLKIKY